MKRFIFVCIFLVTTVTTIDKNVFRSCSKVSFCETLRNNHVDQDFRFYADILSRYTKDYNVIIPLKNGKNDTLNLEISLLETAAARIKIKQPGNERYELPSYFSLKKEPVTVDYYTTNLINRSIAIRHRQIKDFAVLVIEGPPFIVEVYRNDQVILVLNSERFLMENIAKSQAFAFTVQFEAAEKLYGLFDHAYGIVLPETADGSMDPFRLKNVDAYGYEVNSTMALYGSVPVIYGHSGDTTSGIFLHNAAEQWVDISYNSTRPSAYFMVESAAFDLFLFSGPTPKDVVRQFTALTGTAPLPPLWSLGYQQSRMSYSSQEEVKEVVAKMMESKFPMDTIWLDGAYTDSHKWYRWHPTAFSDPIEMQRNISAYNKNCVVMGDASLTVDKNYSIYNGARKQYLVLFSNKTEYKVKVSDLEFAFADYFWGTGYLYYYEQFFYDHFEGSTPTIAGIWNDLNEPGTLVDEYEKTLPSSALHRINEDTLVMDRDVHNIYGLTQSFATYDGLFYRDNQRIRPFVLSRSHYAGSQKFAAMWTGDNTASWEHFAVSISQCLTGNILGMVFCGADIGGFIGDPSDELLQRWYQGAVWLPFFRSHSSNSSNRREPYLFSTEVQDVIRSAIELRYQHIPYLYTLFYEHSITGDPVIRPVFYDYHGVHGYDTQMLVGENIMAVAVVEEAVNSTEVYFPGKDDFWYRIENVDDWLYYKGGETVDVSVDIKSSPVFYKAGSIIVRKDQVGLSTKDTWKSPHTIYLNLDKDNRASGRFYVDDFVTFNYTKNNEYYYYELSYNNDSRIVFKQISGDSTNVHPRFNKVVLHYLSDELLDGIERIVYEKVFETTSDGRHLVDVTFSKPTELVLQL